MIMQVRVARFSGIPAVFIQDFSAQGASGTCTDFKIYQKSSMNTAGMPGIFAALDGSENVAYQKSSMNTAGMPGIYRYYTDLRRA
jgi:hypothetical protein